MAPRGTVTNNALQSDRIDLSPWLGSGIQTPPVAYNGTLPAGVTAMRILSDDSSAGVVHMTRVPSFSGDQAGREAIFSAHLKYVAGTPWMALGGNGGGVAKYLNTQTGALGTAGGGALLRDWGVHTLPDGSYRFWIRYISDGSATFTLYLASADGTVTFNGTGGTQQIAVGGIQHEFTTPGQLTPSPYVVSGATNGVGPRDSRENWMKWSEQIGTSGIWNADGSRGSTYTLNAFTAPDGSNHASAFTYAGNLTSTVGYSIQPFSYTNGSASPWTGVMWVYSPVQLTNQGLVISDGTTYSARQSGVTIPANQWTRMVYTIPAGTLNNTGQVVLGLNAPPASGATIYLWGAQLARTNQVPDYVKTTGSIWVPNGAPRLLAA